MTGLPGQSGIICDANVLIDYAMSAPNVVRLISKHIGKLYIASLVLHELRQLGRADVEKLGIEVVEPAFGQIVEAAQIRQDKSALSGEDAICFIMARDNNWVCLTNDKPLRRVCLDQRIRCVWGLEIMLDLVSQEKLSAEKAHKIAQDIQSKNHYITAKTVERFRGKLGLG